MNVEKSLIGIQSVENKMARIGLSPLVLSIANVTERVRTAGQRLADRVEADGTRGRAAAVVYKVVGHGAQTGTQQLTLHHRVAALHEHGEQLERVLLVRLHVALQERVQIGQIERPKLILKFKRGIKNVRI